MKSFKEVINHVFINLVKIYVKDSIIDMTVDFGKTNNCLENYIYVNNAIKDMYF